MRSRPPLPWERAGHVDQVLLDSTKCCLESPICANSTDSGSSAINLSRQNWSECGQCGPNCATFGDVFVRIRPNLGGMWQTQLDSNIGVELVSVHAHCIFQPKSRWWGGRLGALCLHAPPPAPDPFLQILAPYFRFFAIFPGYAGSRASHNS